MMKNTPRTTLLLLALMLTLQAAGQMKRNQRFQNYIDKYRDVAVYQMLRHNIPASITMAQGLLESGAGESDLAKIGNNHFGIKCHDWRGPSMRRDDDERNECFRVYASPLESYEDHSLFLKRPRYKSLFSLRRTDYVAWAKGLKACGYATNPRYAQQLIDIIRCYNLDALDREKRYNAQNIERLRGGGDGTLPKKFRSHDLANAPHVVGKNNDNYFVVARKGDTFASIASEFSLSARKVAKYNERDRKDVLQEGEMVYLEKKHKKAEKRFKRQPHVVQPGESMYSIAQKYGIRMKYLYKKNSLSPKYYQIKVGDTLRVY